MPIKGATIHPAVSPFSRYFCLNGRNVTFYGNERGDAGAPYDAVNTGAKSSSITSGGKPNPSNISTDGLILPTSAPPTFGILYSPDDTSGEATTAEAIEAKYETNVGVNFNGEWSIRGSDPDRWEPSTQYTRVANMGIVPSFLNVSGANATDTPISAECQVLMQDNVDFLDFVRTTHLYELQETDDEEGRRRIKVTVTMANESAATIQDVRYVVGIDANFHTYPYETFQSFGSVVSSDAFALTSSASGAELHLGLGVANSQVGAVLWAMDSSIGSTTIFTEPWDRPEPYVILTSSTNAEIRANPQTSYCPQSGDTVIASTTDYTDPDFADTVATELGFDGGVEDRMLMLMSPSYDIPIGDSVEFVYYYYVGSLPSPSYPANCGTSNPYTLTGTQIIETDDCAKEWATRVHRQSANQRNEVELWYHRNSAWSLFPVQPIVEAKNGITLTQVYRQPATCEFQLPDNFGLLTPENLNSAYNYVGSTYDPLMDEARKILLRLGIRCYSNLASEIVPTASTAPDEGELSALTDGVHADWSEAGSERVLWTVGSASPITLTLDLGSQEKVQHVAARFGTKLGEVTLPLSVQIGVSTDNATWKSLPVRPLGGTGGDWDDDETGRAVEAIFCDIEFTVRYVRFVIVPTGAQTFGLDEIAVYGGNTTAIYGQNLFTGYLGDMLDFTPEGMVSVAATDVLKKCADNNEVRLTAPYQQAELSEISYSLLTSNAYWKGQADYSDPFDDTEIGWESDERVTDLVWPIWQSQANNILGYLYELWHAAGYSLYADGNGVLRPFEPPYRDRLPDRVFIAAPDGNNDVKGCVRHRTGKDLRNTIEVSSGKIKGGGSSDTLFEPNSVARFGPRRNIITDPIASTSPLQRKLGNYLLRDYAWRLQTLSNVIQPDFDTGLRHIYAFRAPSRPNLFAKASSVTNAKRKGELWGLTSLTHRIGYGLWEADAEYIPYFPLASEPPEFVSLTPGSGATDDEITLVWNEITDPRVVLINVYQSDVGEDGPYHLEASGGISPETVTLSGHTPGDRYWYYLTAVDDRGEESLPSNILTAVADSSPSSSSGWTVDDLAVSLLTRSGPDGQGYYTYKFYLTWESPPTGGVSHPSQGGFKRMFVRANPLALPSGDDEAYRNWAWSDNSWQLDIDYVPPGMTFDRVTPGDLFFTLALRSTYNFTSGQRIYFRMWTSTRNSPFLPPKGWASNSTYHEF